MAGKCCAIGFVLCVVGLLIPPLFPVGGTILVVGILLNNFGVKWGEMMKLVEVYCECGTYLRKVDVDKSKGQKVTGTCTHCKGYYTIIYGNGEFKVTVKKNTRWKFMAVKEVTCQVRYMTDNANTINKNYNVLNFTEKCAEKPLDLVRRKKTLAF